MPPLGRHVWRYDAKYCALKDKYKKDGSLILWGENALTISEANAAETSVRRAVVRLQCKAKIIAEANKVEGDRQLAFQQARTEHYNKFGRIW